MVAIDIRTINVESKKLVERNVVLLEVDSVEEFEKILYDWLYSNTNIQERVSINKNEQRRVYEIENLDKPTKMEFHYIDKSMNKVLFTNFLKMFKFV